MKELKGIAISVILATVAYVIGNNYPLFGGPVLAMVGGVIIGLFIDSREAIKPGLSFCTKKVLQAGVVLLGFGLNLGLIFSMGLTALPTIITAVTMGLFSAYVFNKFFKLSWKQAGLIGVGTCICGGSAVMAAAPVIGAEEEEVATAISVVFLFNLLAAFLFVPLASFIGMDSSSGFAFGLFSGSAVNDTSSVTATAAMWDSFHALRGETLSTAVTVKLVRTLFIIPVVLFMSILGSKREGSEKVSIRKSLPTFILFFLLASLITTILSRWMDLSGLIAVTKTVSKYFITVAMAAVGLNTDLKKLLKKGLKPILLGSMSWMMVIGSVLLVQYLSGLL